MAASLFKMNCSFKKVTLVILSLALSAGFFIPLLPKFEQPGTILDVVSLEEMSSSLSIHNTVFSEYSSYETTTTITLPSTAENLSSAAPTSLTIDYSDITVYTSVFSQEKLDKDIIVIGDVHGCIDDLEKLLEEIKYNPETDYLVFTGDLIVRGPNSFAVIQKVRELEAISVRGNHEDKLIKWKKFLDSSEGKRWSEEDFKPNGIPKGLKINDEHYQLAKNISKEDFEFLSNLPLAIKVSEPINTIIVHAGIDPARFVSLREQDPWVMMNMRNIDTDGTPLKKKKRGRAWAAIWNEYMERRQQGEDQFVIVYGHDAGRGLKIREWSKGLDTGCVYGRQLTAYRLTGKRAGELIQVHCHA